MHILWIFIKPNVWYSSSLKILAIERWFPFSFTKNLQGCHFVVGGPKNFKLLAEIYFESSLQNAVLSSLLLFLCACYYVDEVATSTAPNFKYSWPLYLIFVNMINLCPNIWFIENSKCQQFFHLRKKPPKKQIFHIFKRLLFCNGQPIDMNVDVFWETSVGFLKSVVFQQFPIYSRGNVNLNVKNRSKFNCL